ncbi:helix-turn-helix transcriptional regulator [Azohydromonas lata]|uniref:AlpA family phage regulatory protein n=1 Tax=Azohydromonas lata TaxID=45677 RepID=A0ABU5IFX7_9BURK|nr:AlpA family phage regulatory protein [Azohydromonas lata]MDZ5457897.1 AlpA family phage regulatory protein [Azohydromonas lata]
MRSPSFHIAATKPRQSRQPLQAAENPDALLLVQTVTALTGMSTSTLYRKMAADQFVQPIRLGTRCTRWRAGDVTAWLRQQAANA